MFLAAGALARCTPDPCPDGVLEGSVFIDGHDVTWLASGDRMYALGTTSDSPISKCKEITGSIILTGSLAEMPAFNNLERLGGTITMISPGGETIDGGCDPDSGCTWNSGLNHRLIQPVGPVGAADP